jgi:hypothetical protein
MNATVFSENVKIFSPQKSSAVLRNSVYNKEDFH